MLKQILKYISDNITIGMDGISIGIVIAALVNWIPHITALVSLIWMCIKVYETKTVQKWLGNPIGGQYDNES